MSGLDVNLTLVEPFLLSFEDGPFRVYDQRRCRVQLNFEVSRDVRKDVQKSLAAVVAVLDLFDDAGAAKRAGWNRRKVAAYPKDWEKTKRRLRGLAARADEPLPCARRARASSTRRGRVLDYMPGDDDYLLQLSPPAPARAPTPGRPAKRCSTPPSTSAAPAARAPAAGPTASTSPGPTTSPTRCRAAI